MAQHTNSQLNGISLAGKLLTDPFVILTVAALVAVEIALNFTETQAMCLLFPAAIVLGVRYRHHEAASARKAAQAPAQGVELTPTVVDVREAIEAAQQAVDASPHA